MIPPGIRAVTFDAGGTLIDPHPSVGAVYAEVAASHGVVVPADGLEARFRAEFRARTARPRARVSEADEREFWRVLTAAVFAPWLDAAGHATVFPELWDTFAEARRWRPREGAAEVLQELPRRGLRVAVLSNWDHRLHAVLEGLGWRAGLAAVLVSAEIGAEKPDPAVFARAAAVLGCAPGELLHVGDSPAQDGAGALAAGWAAAVVGERAAEAPPGAWRIGSLRELLG